MDFASMATVVWLLLIVPMATAIHTSRIPLPQPRLDKLLDFFEIHKLEDTLFGEGESPFVNANCRKEVGSYLKGMANGESWADKMFDSTGRYSSHFLFGNDYFLGSHSLCMELGKNVSSPEEESPPKRIGGPWRGPSSFLKWRAKPPPFQLNFHIVKLRVSLPPQRFHESHREVTWGLCLPGGCSEEDGAVLARVMAERKRQAGVAPTSAAVQVISTRRLPGQFSLWADSTFHAMATATFLVLLLTAMGTALDLLRPGAAGGKGKEGRRVGFLGEGREEAGGVQPYGGGGRTCCRHRMGFESKLAGVLRCFSLSRNARKILRGGERAFAVAEEAEGAAERPKDPLDCLHGLRFFSLLWVILGNTFYLSFLYADNKHYRGVVERNFLFQAIGNGSYAVDTFFFISGLLLSFMYFRSAAVHEVTTITLTPSTAISSSAPPLRKRAKQFLSLVAYRVTRLTPLYLFVLGLAELTMKSFRSDSVFEPPGDDDVNCPNHWWRNALYVNTLYPVKEMCMIWSWYLADDTQFYIIGLFIVILASSHFNLAAFSAGITLLASWLTTAVIALDYNYMPRASEPLALFDELYDKPWTRIGPHIIGLIAGWILYRTDCKLKLRKYYLILGWLLSTAVCTVLVYGLFSQITDAMVSATYAALSHTAWAMALSWLVTACAAGEGGWINSFLSCKLLAPLSRLTYSAYLVHPVIIRATVAHMDSPLHITRDSFAFLFAGHVIASYSVAFVISVMLESPIISLLKMKFFTRSLV